MTDSQRWMVFLGVALLAVLVYLLSPVLIPFIVAFLLAYFLKPVVARLHAWKIPRVIAVILVFIVVVIIVTGVLFVLVPAIGNQVAKLAEGVPALIAWFEKTFIPWVSSEFGVQMTAIDFNSLKQMLLGHLSAGGNVAQTIFSTISASGYVLLEIIFNLVMIPVIMLYLLFDWRKVTSKGRAYIPLPEQHRDTVIRALRECGDVLAGFFRGQLLVMIGLAIVYSLGLWLVGLDLALLIGVVSGLLSVVPYLGFISGLLAAILAAVFQYHDWMHVIGVLVVFSVGEICESFIFPPLFVGDRIGLHPVAVIFAVLAGGQLFGFVGVLLALPAAAVIMVFFRHLCHRYFPSKEME
jgi:predicted PurR-regulated permease PerM